MAWHRMIYIVHGAKLSFSLSLSRAAASQVGNMKVPVSKKTTPMEWESILDLLKTIRKDVGLDNTSTTHEDDKFISESEKQEVERQQPNSIVTYQSSR